MKEVTGRNNPLLLLNNPEKLQRLLSEIPVEPGCYLMKDSKDRLLYVGKSKSLRNRIKSYFRSCSNNSSRISLMIRQVHDIEIIITDSEAEALVLESNLIKDLQPHFNILLKDDKKYPYLCITWSEDYPRIFITRKRRNRNTKDRFYGPYVDVGNLRRSLALVKSVFPLRQRPRPLYRDRTCLNYSIGLCPGVCQELISSSDYHKTIKKIAMVFQGRSEELKKLLGSLMDKYSTSLDFERAAKVRDQIRGIEQLNEQQNVGLPDSSVSRDIIALASNDKLVSVQLFQMRAGKLIGRLAFSADATGLKESTIIQLVVEEHYSQVDPVEIPQELILQYPVENPEVVCTWLKERRGRSVDIQIPKRNKKVELVDLVCKNAKYELQRLEKGIQQQELALEDLTQLLELSSVPRRIEGYDISHIQGSDPVASQVVFEDGLPAKQHYRRFNIKSSSIMPGHSDDFMALAEVIRRRFKRWARAKADGFQIKDLKSKRTTLQTNGFNDWPDLVLIDGGKGQLSAVMEAIRELDLEEELTVCSLAKKNEEIYLPNQSSAIISEIDQIGVLLLRRVRDESHRFALSFHRSKRGERMTRSRLGDIPGLGPKRIKELLSHFNSVEAIQMASVDTLMSAPGMGRVVAQQVWEYFHPDPKTEEQDKL
ncbi:excinuclease ABC subunit UvrC [Prochlorococcus sp. MIT 1300]|uniref:excinuclease ABC subunit UvrC n=1 Tax=Prochlorococcus sp. MIT 1300 TaxID=3096218 RepID=UPI002A756C27|nr:excinuclease ABC subunit UvrC [Prochlorococcus sp. MIT 1300]